MRKSIAEAEAARLLVERREIRSSFRRWCEHLLAQRGHVLHRHHLLLIDALEKVNKGEVDRLMISMPPGHGKSEYSDQLFVPYFMANNPGLHVIISANALDLARSFSHKVRGYIHEHANTLGFGVADGQSGFENWAATNGCSCPTKGGGPLSGARGARRCRPHQKAQRHARVEGWPMSMVFAPGPRGGALVPAASGGCLNRASSTRSACGAFCVRLTIGRPRRRSDTWGHIAGRPVHRAGEEL